MLALIPVFILVIAVATAFDLIPQAFDFLKFQSDVQMEIPKQVSFTLEYNVLNKYEHNPDDFTQGFEIYEDCKVLFCFCHEFQFLM